MCLCMCMRVRMCFVFYMYGMSFFLSQHQNMEKNNRIEKILLEKVKISLKGKGMGVLLERMLFDINKTISLLFFSGQVTHHYMNLNHCGQIFKKGTSVGDLIFFFEETLPTLGTTLI